MRGFYGFMSGRQRYRTTILPAGADLHVFPSASLAPPSYVDWVLRYDGIDSELDRFWIDSIFDQYRWAGPDRRKGAYWSVNRDAMLIIRRATLRYQGAWSIDLPHSLDQLLGMPVLIDQTSPGAVLVFGARS